MTVVPARLPEPRALPVLVLVGANLVPLAGVAVFGWSLFELVLIYWLENGVVGAYNLLRMGTARGGSPTVPEKVFRGAFFTVHYGLFWAVHGAFVFSLFGHGFGAPNGLAQPFSLPPGTAEALGPGVALGVLSLVLSHGVSFAQNWIAGGERDRVGLDTLFSQPYARVVVLHFTILGGGFAAGYLGSPAWALLMMVALKIAVDVAAHRREHRTLH